MNEEPSVAGQAQPQALPVAPVPSAFPDLPPAPVAGPSAYAGPATSDGTNIYSAASINGAYGVQKVMRVGAIVSSVIMIFTGLAFAGIAFLVQLTSKIPANYSRTSGQVIQQDVRQDFSNSSKTSRSTYFPIIKFSVSGKEYMFTSNSGSKTQSFPVGTTVDVAYDPANPDKSPKNASDKSAKYIVPIFEAVGLLVVAVGVFRIVRSKRSSL